MVLTYAKLLAACDRQSASSDEDYLNFGGRLDRSSKSSGIFRTTGERDYPSSGTPRLDRASSEGH
jgi:hypothetical protein